MTTSKAKLIALLVLYVLCAFVYAYLHSLMRRRLRNKNNGKPYYFAYCDGSTRNVVSIERVSYEEFCKYDSLITYGVLHIAANKIYFDINTD